MGWASGRFGILGVKEQEVENQAMNIIGILMCIGSMAIMFNVKTVKAEQEAAGRPFTDPMQSMIPDDSLSISANNLLSDDHYALKQTTSTNAHSHYDSNSPKSDEPVKHSEVNWTEKLSPGTKKLLGISLALFAGCLYGRQLHDTHRGVHVSAVMLMFAVSTLVNFNPPQYLIDSGRGSSSHGIDYVFRSVKRAVI